MPMAYEVNCLRVMEESPDDEDADPIMLVGCNNGAIQGVDLAGHDRGQVYTEMRSLNWWEVCLPPAILMLTVVQYLSFAFGPSVPWHPGVKARAQYVFKLAMLDFDWTLRIDKDRIYWPEAIVTICGMVFFLGSALT